MEPTQWTVRAGQPPHQVWLRITPTHESILAELYGGTRPHLGAWAAANPAGILVDEGVFGTHKELPLARQTASALAEASCCNTVAVAGIHVDNATRAEIDLLCANAEDVIRQAAGLLAESQQE